MTCDGGSISFRVDDLLVIHSLTGASVELDGSYEIVYSNARAVYGTVSGTLSVGNNESVVLKKVG